MKWSNGTEYEAGDYGVAGVSIVIAWMLGFWIGTSIESKKEVLPPPLAYFQVLDGVYEVVERQSATIARLEHDLKECRQTVK